MMSPDQTGKFGAFDQMARMMTDAAQKFGTFGLPSSDTAGKGGGNDAQRRMIEMHVAVVNSGLRYLQRWTEISATHYPGIVSALFTMNPDSSKRGAELGAAVDSARAFLREMAELPLDESQRLQAELERITGMKKADATAAPKAAPKRRARAKQ